MVLEFALEPSLLRNWKDFRYLIEKFGVDRGRLISRYPKDWKRLVYDSLTEVADIDKARITEKLRFIDDRLLSRFHEWHQQLSWLHNAEEEHAKRPFHAIIASSNPRQHARVLDAETLDETVAQFVCPRTAVVRRTASEMARCVAPLLRCSRLLVFVDPYFGPDSSRHRGPLDAFLREALVRPSGSRIERLAYHTATPATEEFLRSECESRLAPLIPVGLTLTVCRWNKEDLHNRYVLTERGGIQFGTGLDEGENPPDDLISLVDSSSYATLWTMFTGAASGPSPIIVRGRRTN